MSLRKRVTRSSWRAVSTALIALLLLTHAQAAVYEYRDDRGKRVFVDSLSKVPAEYRDQLKTREELRADPADTAVAERLQAQARLERAIREIDQVMLRRTVPISTRNNQVLVPIKVARGNRTQTLQLLFDTGANRTVFHRSALASLGGEARPAGAANTASGEQIQLYSLNLDRLEIGPFEIAPAQVQVIDYRGESRHQGLLGMDLLSQVRYELDIERQELRWAPDQFERLEQERLQLVDQLEQLKAPTDAEPATAPSEP